MASAKLKVKMLKKTVANKVFVKKDAVVELDSAEANYLIAIKKAVLVKEKEAAPAK